MKNLLAIRRYAILVGVSLLFVLAWAEALSFDAPNLYSYADTEATTNANGVVFMGAIPAAMFSPDWNLMQGTALRDYQGVEFECTYVPESGSNQVVRAKSTVFECYTQPVSNTPRIGLEVINPSFLNPQSNSVFRVEVNPAGIPSSKINWRVAAGSAAFQSGTNGTETVVLGSSGMVGLEVNVLGATDERMHFKSQVVQ